MKARYLSQAEAERCENAREPVCRCRCGGEKHGAARVSQGGAFSSLPFDDPHFRPEMNRAQAKRFLRDALNRMTFPILRERDECVAKFGWDQWLEQRHQEESAFHEAQRIIADAIRAL